MITGESSYSCKRFLPNHLLYHVPQLNPDHDYSVPHEGAHINFVKSLEGIADGDFDVNYVHGSRASLLLHPSSPGTAAVQDVADGLVDIVIGPIWITGGRLKMTSFTMPIRELFLTHICNSPLIIFLATLSATILVPIYFQNTIRQC